MTDIIIMPIAVQGNCPGWMPDGTPNWPDWRWNDTTTFVAAAAAGPDDGTRLPVVAWHYYSYYGCHNASTTESCTPGLPPAVEALVTPAFLDRTAERAGRYSRLQERADMAHCDSEWWARRDTKCLQCICIDSLVP